MCKDHRQLSKPDSRAASMVIMDVYKDSALQISMDDDPDKLSSENSDGLYEDIRRLRIKVVDMITLPQN